MSSDRRFEYDTGPRVEDGLDGETDAADGPDDGNGDGDGPTETDGSAGIVASAAAGIGWGAGAFAVVFAAIYQVTAARLAMGGFISAETDVSQLGLTGVTMLASHGGTIEVDGEPIEGAAPATYTAGLVNDITALLPAVVLVVAGSLLVRYVALETGLEAVLGLGGLVAGYVALGLVLAPIASWTPEEGPDAETIAVAADLGTALGVARTALVFALVGAAIAALPRLLASSPLESVARTE